MPALKEVVRLNKLHLLDVKIQLTALHCAFVVVKIYGNKVPKVKSSFANLCMESWQMRERKLHIYPQRDIL